MFHAESLGALKMSKWIFFTKNYRLLTGSKHEKNVSLNISFFQITFLDMLLYSIFMENGFESKALRWSRILRPVFLINLEGRQVRSKKIRVSFRGFHSSKDNNFVSCEKSASSFNTGPTRDNPYWTSRRDHFRTDTCIQRKLD